jgi:lactoylglutathione lyase
MTRLSINHLNLAVRDIPATREFLRTWFGFTCTMERDAFSILEDAEGFVLTLMPLKTDDPSSYPGSFHLGFYIPVETVESMHAAMAAAGLTPGAISRIHRGTMFYVSDPSGILIEVGCPR